METPTDILNMIKALGGEGINLALADATNWDAYAIISREYVEVQGIEGLRTTLLIRTEDVYQPGQVQTAVFRADTVNTNTGVGGFDIVEFQPDGTGMTLLILEAQA